MERILGIDYGERNVGIALSDHAGHFAFPKKVFENNDALLENIATLAHEEQVGAIALGDTENPAGGPNQITHRVNVFKAALEVRTKLPVHFVDEAYTSAEAKRAIQTSEPDRSTSTPPVDAAAAALILQHYLDAQRNKH